MSFTDGKPWIVTEADTKAPWSGARDGKNFRCSLCGHKFVVGDTARWQYTNDIPGAGGNPTVCAKCDTGKEKIIETWKAMREDAKTRMWWFTRETDHA